MMSLLPSRGGPSAWRRRAPRTLSYHKLFNSTWSPNVPAARCTATATDCPAATSWQKKEGSLGCPLTSKCSLRSSGDLVDGREGNLVRLKLRSSVDYLAQRLQHFRIDRAAVGLRVLLRLPEADRDRFRSAGYDEGHFVLEALLLAKYGKYFLLEGLRELHGAVGLELHADISSEHFRLRAADD